MQKYLFSLLINLYQQYNQKYTTEQLINKVNAKYLEFKTKEDARLNALNLKLKKHPEYTNIEKLPIRNLYYNQEFSQEEIDKYTQLLVSYQEQINNIKKISKKTLTNSNKTDIILKVGCACNRF